MNHRNNPQYRSQKGHAMSNTLQQRTLPSSKKIARLRINSFAASIQLMVVFGFGSIVNLYAKLPRTDHGTSLFAEFDAAITVGPVSLAIHAVLGTLLVLTGIATAIAALSYTTILFTSPAITQSQLPTP